MKTYDQVIRSFLSLLESNDPRSFSLSSRWEKSDKPELVFPNDSIVELGGGECPGLGGLFLTSDHELVGDPSLVILGKDIKQFRGDVPYARIVIAEVDDSKMGEGNAIYQNIRKVDYVRYHLEPKGAMFRISPMSKKESVRISKSALKEGIDFLSLGGMMADAYMALPMVTSVKVILISDPDFDYKQAERLIQRSEDITSALDHLLGKVSMDCSSCALQVVCDEVEKLVESDFQKK